MRLRLLLSTVDSHNKIIPVNYQYPISAMIYHTIAEGNHPFAEFLHNSGFSSENKNYKLFTFSQLRFPPKGFRVEDDRLHILSNQFSLDVSFMVPAAVEHFIAGLFKSRHFSLGDVKSQAQLIVNSVEVLPEPLFENSIKLHCLSPVVIGKQVENRNTAEYLAPGHVDYNRILTENLIRKYTAAIQSGFINPSKEIAGFEPVVSTEVINTPRRWGITIKANTPSQTKIIGYTFDFLLTAPPDLIRTGYLCGFGEKNALGMGCVEVI